MKNLRNLTRRRVLVLTLRLLVLSTCALVTLTFGSNKPVVASPANLSSPLSPGMLANGRIAFESNRERSAEIYTVNPDGSDLKQLTFEAAFENPGSNLLPVWSPDGTRIAFQHAYRVWIANYPWDFRDLYAMNADGSNQTRLTSSNGTDSRYAWSPDGSKIAFVRWALQRDVGFWVSRIYVIDADGGNQRQLAKVGFGTPAWSPDGTEIAFDDDSATYVINADGTNQRKILVGYGSPAWSPDGSKLAVTPTSGGGGVAIVNRDGSEFRLLNRPDAAPNMYPSGDTHTRWSPDGSKIVVARSYCYDWDCNSGDDRISVVDSDGHNPHEFSRGSNTWASNPEWSPDGRKIIFEDGDLSVMNPDGSNAIRIPNTNPGYGPSWQTVRLAPNLIDDTQFFVRQHYLDFLNREPDSGGLAFWTNEITSCGADPQCVDAKRINVSAAYFLSIEFQETGYLVYRMYKAAYGNLPNAPVPITLNEFLPDTREIGQGVIVNQAGWQQTLENNKQAFITEFVQRSRFTSAYPQAMTPADFVDKLNANAGGPLSSAERDQLISDIEAGVKTRAEVLRAVAENEQLAQQEFNRAFVLMQYFGYLRRNPNDAPDDNFDGYNFWLNKLNQFNGNFIDAEMVKAFLVSTEYRQRFEP